MTSLAKSSTEAKAGRDEPAIAEVECFFEAFCCLDFGSRFRSWKRKRENV
jgi:hypothetical protein